VYINIFAECVKKNRWNTLKTEVTLLVSRQKKERCTFREPHHQLRFAQKHILREEGRNQNMEEQWRGLGNEDEEAEEGEDETSYPAALEPSFDGEGGSTPYANSNGYYHEAYGKLEVLKPQERIPIRNWYARMPAPVRDHGLFRTSQPKFVVVGGGPSRNEEFQSVLGGIARCGDAGKLDHYNKLSSLAHGTYRSRPCRRRGACLS
jgi:hypothetical protein